jgi:hypothetical protein
LAWCLSLEKRFRFDPTKGIDPREIIRVEQEVLLERRASEGTVSLRLCRA